MKRITIIAMVTLMMTGCQSVWKSNMLDVAPKTNYEVMHPDWGVPTQIKQREIYQVVHKKQTVSPTLISALQQNGIGFDRVDGQFAMLKLKPRVQFDTNSAQISHADQQWLMQLRQVLAQYNNLDVLIDGYTDNSGENVFNQTLAKKRAAQVERILKLNRRLEPHVYARGYGAQLPSCSNRDSQGRACNRRVELTLIVSQ